MRFLVLALLLLPTVADAGLVKVVADLQVCDGTLFCRNERSYGSGAVVGNFNGKSIVLTAAHIFEPHDKNGLPVRDNRGKVHRIRVNGFNATLVNKWSDGGQAMDMAIVLVDKRFSEEIPLADTVAKVGDTVTIYGWDFADRENPQLWTNSGKYIRIEPRSMASVSFTSGVGVSGGPAIDAAGNLSGILVQSSGVQLNYDLRKCVMGNIPGANLPPPLKRYERKVPEPEDVPPPPSQELIDAQKEAAALRAALDRAKSQLAKTKQEKKDAVEQPEAQKPEEKVETEEKDDVEEKPVLEKVATGVSKTLDTADRVANNPWIMAAIIAATGGAGAGGLKAFQLFSAARKLRKKVHPLPSDQPVSEVPDKKPFPDQPQRQLHTREEQEVRELLRLRQLEGRSPLLDSFVGVAFQDFVANDLETDKLPAEQKEYIRDLWSRINERVESAAPINTGSSYSDDWRNKDV